MSTIILSLHQNGRGFLRLSKNLYNEKGCPPYPYQSAKSRDLCVAFCTSQVRGAPLVRWPDGHTFFAFLHRTCPARERSMGAEALRQPLAKTRKSGISHFFGTLKATLLFPLLGPLPDKCRTWRCRRIPSPKPGTVLPENPEDAGAGPPPVFPPGSHGPER